MLLTFAILTCIFSLTSLCMVFYMLGKRSRTVALPPEVDEHERRKQQKLLKDFNEVMNYNEKQAYKRVYND